MRPRKVLKIRTQSFLLNQRKREKQWRANRREGKKVKIDWSTPIQLSTLPGATVPTNKDPVPEMNKQLATKTEERSKFKVKLDSAEEALKSQLQIFQVRFLKVCQ